MMNRCLLCQERILTKSDVLDILGIRTTQPAVCAQCLTQLVNGYASDVVA